MLWRDIKAKHPAKWLVIEAKKCRQAEDIFIVEGVEILDVFDQSFGAYDEYRK